MEKAAPFCDLLGGKEAIKQVVSSFYERVIADDTVKSYFSDTDWEKQIYRQTHFISYVLGGPNASLLMQRAHKGLQLQPHHFEAIVTHLKDALAEFNVDEKAIRMVVDAMNDLQEDILYR